MTDSCILILHPTSLPRSPISCNSSPILGGFCFKMGAICSLMAEGANDARGQGERTVTGVGLLSSKRGRRPRAKQDWCPYISNLWAFPSSCIFYSVKWQEGWSIGIGFEYSRRPQRMTWTWAHETRVVTGQPWGPLGVGGHVLEIRLIHRVMCPQHALLPPDCKLGNSWF